MYQGSADRCEGDHKSDRICLLQPSQAIHHCNQSVLAIVPDLNIFIFSVTIFDLISRSALTRFSLLHARYLYNSAGIRFYIFCLLPASRLRDFHCHGWVYYIVLQRYSFNFCAILSGFWSFILKFISIYPESTHTDKQQHHFICDSHFHGWVYYIDTTKIRF